MESRRKLTGLTVFITGASRGIGRAIAIKVAEDGANVVIAAKTAHPDPFVPGTIYQTLQEVENAGGKGLACITDIREEDQVQIAVDAAVQKFGGIDILVNNASIVGIGSTETLDMEDYDDVNNTNTRGTFLVSKLCLPYLKKSSHAHILNISPPLKMGKMYFGKFGAYAISKFGMTLCALGMHQEFLPYNISVNTLWPKGVIATASVIQGLGETVSNHCRKPEIMADAAYEILTQHPKPTGQCFLDEDVLLKAGVTNLDQYLVNSEFKNKLYYCYYEDEPSSIHAAGPLNMMSEDLSCFIDE